LLGIFVFPVIISYILAPKDFCIICLSNLFTMAYMMNVIPESILAHIIRRVTTVLYTHDITDR